MNSSVNSEMNGEYESIDMKQRRACGYFKNNPSAVLNASVNTFTGVPLGGPIDPSMGGYEDAPGTKYGEPDIALSMDIINKPEYAHVNTNPSTSPDDLKKADDVEKGAQLPMNLSDKVENFSVSYSKFRTTFVLILHLIALIVLVFLIWRYT